MRFQFLPLREKNSQEFNENDASQNGNDKGPLWLAVCILLIFITKYAVFKKMYFTKQQSGSNYSKKSSDNSNSISIDDIWFSTFLRLVSTLDT